MNLILNRKYKRSDGIFGELLNASTKEVLMHTLEHAFLWVGDSFKPAIPIGTYQCQRSPHHLAHMNSDFMTFEVQNVPGHTGILFHVGNFNSDSEGCILLGMSLCQGPRWFLYRSREAFCRLMQSQIDVDTFHLTVIDNYET